MNAHVLLVEDDDGLGAMLKNVLSRAGYQVTRATNGAQAIELLQQQSSTGHDDYDVVLSDIVMGEIDGIKVMEVARSCADAPEVILLTSYGSLQSAMEAVRKSAFDYLLKPCPKEQLLERVSAAVEQRNSRLQLVEKAAKLQRIAEVMTGNTLLEGTAQETGGQVATHVSLSPVSVAEEQPAVRYRCVGRLHIDTYRHEVSFDGKLLHLTPTEYMIVVCLAATPGRVVSYGDIVRSIRGYEIEESEAHELLRTHIRNLRRKVDRRYLVSVYAVGYILDEPDS